MKKFLSILLLVQALFGVAGSQSAFAVCTSPVSVDPDSDNPYLVDLQSALNYCAGSYSDDLEFRLATDYVEQYAVAMPSGYLFTSGNLIIDGRNSSNLSSSVWEDSGRFIFEPYPDPNKSYAIIASGGPGFQTILRGVQFKALINDYWDGSNAVVVIGGNVTVEDCFIWLYTPSSVSTQVQRGTGIKFIGGGSNTVRNTIIYGDYRANPGYGWFDAAVRIGTYAGTVNFYSTTIYSRRVGSDPVNQPDEYASFAAGIYRTAYYTVDVSNCYIRSYGTCISSGSNITGNYNLCNNADPYPSTEPNWTQTTQGAQDAFESPWSATPNFSIEDDNYDSDLYNAGSTTRNHADLDINGASRPSSGSISVGADEY